MDVRIEASLQAATAMTPVGSSLIPTVNGMLFPLAIAIVLNMAGGHSLPPGLHMLIHRRIPAYTVAARSSALPGPASLPSIAVIV